MSKVEIHWSTEHGKLHGQVEGKPSLRLEVSVYEVGKVGNRVVETPSESFLGTRESHAVTHIWYRNKIVRTLPSFTGKNREQALDNAMSALALNLGRYLAEASSAMEGIDADFANAGGAPEVDQTTQKMEAPVFVGGGTRPRRVIATDAAPES